jgi:hypothetical protein
MFSLSASLQAADTAPAPSTGPEASIAVNDPSAADATTQGESGMHAKSRHAHHAAKHSSTQARSPAMAMTATGTGNPAYRSALRDCVAGPEGQRDSCLDDAIARFGQS